MPPDLQAPRRFSHEKCTRRPDHPRPARKQRAGPHLGLSGGEPGTAGSQPFDNLLIGLNQDRYDFVIASHGITPERQKAVDFSNPHYCTGGALVSKVGGPKMVADLKGKAVAVQVGTTYLENVQKVAGIGKVSTFPKDTDAQAALMAGRVDVWVGDKFSALDVVKAQKGKLQLGDLLFQERIAMAVKKGNASLLKELNSGLATELSNGTYTKLSQQYFAQDIRCK